MRPRSFALAILASLLLLPLGTPTAAAEDAPYEYPTDPAVRAKLEHWQDLKFGFMMHWGLYAQLGIVESWALCSEDKKFQTNGRKGLPYDDFKRMYFGLIDEFNPRRFDPAPWARAARAAGMKYLVFTTKHHDGFSMWDTRQTDFRITSPASPFHDHPRADIVKAIFDTFRAEDFMIGAYFSKADWHQPDYWWPQLATPNRNNNYDTRKYPEKWQHFRDFTYRQIEELMTGYGQVDILWLDGGWVRPLSTVNDEVRSWRFDIAPWDQDIDMPRITAMARGHQPGLLVVDRTVHGPYENYRTPEQRVPKTALPYPWETNMTMSQSWSYNRAPRYKTTEKLIHTLVDVVAKGGNFLLNVGPSPDGTLDDLAYQRLAEIGAWMDVNGEAIYATRQWSRYGDGDAVRFTRTKDGATLYALALAWPGRELRLPGVIPATGSAVQMLGDARTLPWETTANGDLLITIPGRLQAESARPAAHAWAFRIPLR